MIKFRIFQGNFQKNLIFIKDNYNKVNIIK